MSDINTEEFFDESLGGLDSAEMTKRIEASFKELISAEEEIEILKAQTETQTAIVNKQKSDTLPALLKEFGSEIWRDPETGIAIELETAVNSKLPKDVAKRNETLDALRPIGIEEILGEEFNVTFIPNDRRSKILRALLGLEVEDEVVDDGAEDTRLTNEERDAVERLREVGKFSDMPASEKLGVHPSRLKSWLTKRIAAGKGQEVTDAGIWHGKRAKIVRPKGGK